MASKKLTISNNSTSIARTCWRKFELQYCEGLKPKAKSHHLHTGTIVHDAFNRRYSGEAVMDTLNWIHTEFNTLIKAADPENEEDLIVAKHTSLGMFEFFPADLFQFADIQSEKEFEVELVKSPHITLNGRVDGDVTINSGINVPKQFWVREFKTTGIGLRQFKGMINVSYQPSGYIFGLSMLEQRKYEGVIYDVIRKPLLRKRVRETADQFGKRIYDDYSETRYDLARCNSYYQRMYIYRNNYQMTEYLKDISQLAIEIYDKLQNKKFYRNPDACWLYNQECKYSPICWKDQKDWDQTLVDSLFDRTGVRLEL